MTASIYTDGTYAARNPAWHAEDGSWKAGHAIDLLHRNAITPSSIVDIGCGTGEMLRQLARRLGVRGEGYDISPQVAAFWGTEPDLSFHIGELPDESKHFELAVAADVFEHVEDYIGFLRRLRSVADLFVFHIPLDISIHAVARGTFDHTRWKLGHLHYFTKETALATLAHCGYEAVDWHYTYMGLERTDWKAQLLRLPRLALRAVNKDLGVRFLGGASMMVLCK